MSARGRATLVWAAKIVAAAALLGWLIAAKKFTADDTARAFASLWGKWPLIPACAAVLAITPLLGAFRWRLLLLCQGYAVSYWRVLHLTLVGLLFDCVGIGYTGGDVVKAGYAAADQPKGKRAEAVTTVVLDRLVGLTGLLLTGAAAAVIEVRRVWDTLQLRLTLLTLLAILGTAALVFLLAFSRRFAESRIVTAGFARLPGGATLLRVYQAVRLYHSRPGVLLATLGISILAHGCTLVAVRLLAAALGLPGISPAEFVFCVLVGLAASSVGLFQGIGLLQAAFGFLFGLITGSGAGTTFGVNLATLLQACMVVFKLSVGLPAFLAVRRLKPPDETIPEAPDA